MEINGAPRLLRIETAGRQKQGNRDDENGRARRRGVFIRQSWRTIRIGGCAARRYETVCHGTFGAIGQTFSVDAKLAWRALQRKFSTNIKSVFCLSILAKKSDWPFRAR